MYCCSLCVCYCQSVHIDMTFDYWMVHRPKKCMFRKRAVVISTSAGAGTKSAIKDVCDALLYLGVPSVTKYGVAVQAMNWESISEKKRNKIDRDTTKIAKKLSMDKKPSVVLHDIHFLIHTVTHPPYCLNGDGISKLFPQTLYINCQGIVLHKVSIDIPDLI